MKRHLCSFSWLVVAFALILAGLSPSADAAVVAYQDRTLFTTPGDPADYVAQPLYTTNGPPGDYIVEAPSGFDGVAMVDVVVPSGAATTVRRGSGALLWTGKHLLTAAHLVTDNSTGAVIATSASVFFDLPGGRVEIAGVSFLPHPDWDGKYRRGNDIAIITLQTEAPAAAQRYDIYEGADEVGRVGTKAGYGQSGQGQVELIGITPKYPAGTKRAGQNKYDALADLMYGSTVPGFVFGSVLQYDFDNGLAANDGFGYFFGLSDLGVGELEVMGAPGDSGGPTFIDGKIAGLTSYEVTLFRSPYPYTSDITPLVLDSSFGEFVGDTRVSFYADWIRTAIPEPSSVIVWSLLTGLVITAGLRRARRR
jgi:hypothetical protein